jgi:pantothenate synthetase
VADPDTLEELDHVHKRAMLSLAVFFGSVRLIDNLIVEL